MPFPIIPFLITAVTWLGRAGMAAFAVNEIYKLTTTQKNTMSEAVTQAEAGGLSEDEQKKLIAATTYEQVEKAGKNPNDFWDGLSESEKLQLKYGPDSVLTSMNRTTFLGTAQTVLWVAAAAAAGFAAFRGIPIVSKGLGQLIAARQRGAGATELLTYIEQTKMGILAKVWIPGTVASIAAAGGWLTGALANNMNDAFLWGPTFLDQAAQDVQKAADKLKQGTSTASGGSTTSSERRTIIRMVTETKPTQFLGTLFSAKLGNSQQFERVLDDKITDMEDLMADVKINLNRWLGSLPSRMGYSIVIRKDPVDEYGAKQSGVWATLTLFMTHISGKTLPIDTILLGPVDPKVRMEITRETKTIEAQIPDLLTSQEVREIDLPVGTVDIFSVDGARVFPSDISNNATPTTTPTTTPVTGTFYFGMTVNGVDVQYGPFSTEAEKKAEQAKVNAYLSSKGMSQANPREWPNNPGRPPGPVVTSSPVSTPTTTQPTTSSSSTTLRKGDKGDKVKAWQIALNTFGEKLTVDGDFGALTDSATRRFQQRAHITVDGIVGPETYAALTSGKVPML